jgi:GTP cyclohydrolase II
MPDSKTNDGKHKKIKHIKLSTHPGAHGPKPLPIKWGASNPKERGAIIATVSDFSKRNVIGTHSGSYALYRALAVAAGQLDPLHKSDLTNTAPAEPIGPFPQWGDPKKIVSIDPYGHMVADAFKELIEQGYDIRPTIAVTKARINMPELKDAITAGRIKPDGKILRDNGDVSVTKAAIEPVWYLPGVAERFGIDEGTLRTTLFENTGGMFPELITRPDLDVFLPPIGGMSIYLFGDVASIPDESRELACRVHDECNGSDVFGSDICTCRPYLVHGIELCIEAAQRNGAGVVIYNRKEGRALGEVTKFLVYNARKRQAGGDRAEKYFERTECVAGVQDMRFQELMPDPLHWLGITKIHNFASMSNMKFDALAKAGIKIENRISIPEGLIPPDAQVEMDAKKAAGYFTAEGAPDQEELKKQKGRSLNE